MRSRPGTTALASLLALLLCLVAAGLSSGAASPDGDCVQPEAQSSPGDQAKVDPGEKAFLHEIGGQRSGQDSDELKFRTRDGTVLREGGRTLSGEAVGSFTAVQDEGDGRIRPSAIHVGVRGVARSTVVVNVCIDTAGLAAGKYVGSVFVRGDEIESFEVPVTATVRDSRWALWLFLTVLAALAGFALRTVANLGQIAETPPTGRRRRRPSGRITAAIWRAYRRHWTFWVSLVVTLGGVVVAWLTAYLGDATWGASLLTDVMRLLGSAFAAALAGTTFTDLAGKVVSRDPVVRD